MSLTLRLQGREITARTPDFAEVLSYEREQEKNQFQALRNLYKKCRIGGDDNLPAALELSFMGAILKEAGSGADVRLVDDEFEYLADLAEAMVKYVDRGPFHVFETCGLYVLTREPKNAEMEAYWRTRDKSTVTAAHGLIKGVTLFVTGAPADDPMQPLVTKYPCVLVGIAAGITEMAGLSLDVQVVKS